MGLPVALGGDGAEVEAADGRTEGTADGELVGESVGAQVDVGRIEGVRVVGTTVEGEGGNTAGVGEGYESTCVGTSETWVDLKDGVLVGLNEVNLGAEEGNFVRVGRRKGVGAIVGDVRDAEVGL